MEVLILLLHLYLLISPHPPQISTQLRTVLLGQFCSQGQLPVSTKGHRWELLMTFFRMTSYNSIPWLDKESVWEINMTSGSQLLSEWSFFYYKVYFLAALYSCPSSVIVGTKSIHLEHVSSFMIWLTMTNCYLNDCE